MSEESGDSQRTIAVSAFVLALLTLVLSLHNFTRTTGLANGALDVDAALQARNDQRVDELGVQIQALQSRVAGLEAHVAAEQPAVDAVAQAGR